MQLDGNYWVIECEPHVRMRLKNLFKRINAKSHGSIRIRATDETCRELEWFMQRFPLEVRNHEELLQRARRFDARTEAATKIIAGNYQPPTIAMAIPPREYQLRAAALTHAMGGLLLADDLGLGKTAVGLCLLTMPGTLPAIVVCPTHLPMQWVREASKFTPGLVPHVVKQGTPYDLPEHDILVINYHKFAKWSDTLRDHYRTIVFDEIQELRRSDSFRWHGCKHVAEGCDFRLGLSATPIYNYGAEFWNVVHILRPDSIGEREEFLREWCLAFGHDDGKAHLGDARAFGTWLREEAIMLRRKRADVGRELPALSRIVHTVESDHQRIESVEGDAVELAKIILGLHRTEAVADAEGADDYERGEAMRASAELSAKLRLVTGLAKAPYVAEFARMLIEDGEPVVLFGWHHDVYRIWAERLKAYKPAWYTGNESPAKKAESIATFVEGGTDLLIMSLRAGMGVDGLQHRCSTVVFGELDWSYGAMEQCVGRVHRDGQSKPVFAYYPTSEDGADPVMLDVLGVKRGQMEGARDPDEVVATRTLDPDHIKKLAESYLQKVRR